MASLRKQLEILRPLLNPGLSPEELRLQLMAQQEEAYYRDPCHLLHGLGQLEGQARFFTFATGMSLELFFDKLSQLVQAADPQAKPQFTETAEGWQMQIRDRSYLIGKIPLVFSRHLDAKTLNVPDFIRNLNRALKPILKGGNFHFGYGADADTNYATPFVYVLLFVPAGQERLLRQFKGLEWQHLGDSPMAQKTGSIRIAHFPGAVELRWRRRTTWLTTVLLIAGVILLTALVNLIFEFREIRVPLPYLLWACLVTAILGLLDYVNRDIRMRIEAGTLRIRGGVIPLLPGFKRRSYILKDILRVWTKTIISSWSADEAIGSYAPQKAVYITTTAGKEIKIARDLEKYEATMVESQVKKWVGKKMD